MQIFSKSIIIILKVMGLVIVRKLLVLLIILFLSVGCGKDTIRNSMIEETNEIIEITDKLVEENRNPTFEEQDTFDQFMEFYRGHSSLNGVEKRLFAEIRMLIDELQVLDHSEEMYELVKSDIATTIESGTE